MASSAPKDNTAEPQDASTKLPVAEDAEGDKIKKKESLSDKDGTPRGKLAKKKAKAKAGKKSTVGESAIEAKKDGKKPAAESVEEKKDAVEGQKPAVENKDEHKPAAESVDKKKDAVEGLKPAAEKNDENKPAGESVEEKQDPVEGQKPAVEKKDEYKPAAESVEEKQDAVEGQKPTVEKKDENILAGESVEEKQDAVEGQKPIVEKKDEKKPAGESVEEKQDAVEGQKPTVEEKNDAVEGQQPAVENIDVIEEAKTPREEKPVAEDKDGRKANALGEDVRINEKVTSENEEGAEPAEKETLRQDEPTARRDSNSGANFRSSTGNASKRSGSRLNEPTPMISNNNVDSVDIAEVSIPDTQVAINSAATKVLDSLAAATQALEENLLVCKDVTTRHMLEDKKHALLVQMDNMRELLKKHIAPPSALRINGPLNSSIDTSMIENRELREMVDSLDDMISPKNFGSPKHFQSPKRIESPMHFDRDSLSNTPSNRSLLGRSPARSGSAASSNLTAAVSNLQRVRRQVGAANEGRDIADELVADTWYPLHQVEKDVPELRRVRRQIRYLFGNGFDDLSEAGTPRLNSPLWINPPPQISLPTQVPLVPLLPPVRTASPPESKASEKSWSHVSSSYISETVSDISRHSKRKKHHRHRHLKDDRHTSHRDDRSYREKQRETDRSQDKYREPRHDTRREADSHRRPRESDRSRDRDSGREKHLYSKPLPRNWADDVVKAALEPQNQWSFEKDEVAPRTRARWEQPRQKSTPTNVVQQARERANEILRTEGYR